MGHGVALGAVAVTPHPSLVYTVANTTFVTFKGDLFTNLQFIFINVSQNIHKPLYIQQERYLYVFNNHYIIKKAIAKLQREERTVCTKVQNIKHS